LFYPFRGGDPIGEQSASIKRPRPAAGGRRWSLGGRGRLAMVAREPVDVECWVAFVTSVYVAAFERMR
jgi:hypothetical protein